MQESFMNTICNKVLVFNEQIINSQYMHKKINKQQTKPPICSIVFTKAHIYKMHYIQWHTPNLLYRLKCEPNVKIVKEQGVGAPSLLVTLWG
jgi:hypothetical protein